MKTLEGKLIVYDSNCKVCSSLRDLVLRFTSIPENKVIAYKDLSSDLASRIDGDKFKNVMALIETSGESTLYGAEGVAYIFSSQYKIADRLLRIKPFFNLFNFLYKTQAYNRYIIATPKSKFECDCFPDKVVKYRIGYIAICIAFSVLLTGLFGISLKNFFKDIPAWHAAGQMLLMAGTGWVIQMLLSVVFLKDRALDYIGHLASIMVVGLLLLTPWMLFGFISGIRNIYLPALSVLVSSAVMLFLHVYRTRHLELPQVVTVSWFLLLQSAAFFWINVFHLK